MKKLLIISFLLIIITGCKANQNENITFEIPSELYDIINNEESGMLETIILIDENTFAISTLDGMIIYNIETKTYESYPFPLNNFGLEFLNINPTTQEVIGFDLGVLSLWDFSNNIKKEITFEVTSSALKFKDHIMIYTYGYTGESTISLYDFNLDLIETFNLKASISINDITNQLTVYAHNDEDYHIYEYNEDQKSFKKISDNTYIHTISIQAFNDNLLIKSYDFDNNLYQVYLDTGNTKTLLKENENQIDIKTLSNYKGFVLYEKFNLDDYNLYNELGELIKVINSNYKAGFIDLETYYKINNTSNELKIYNIDDTLLNTISLDNISYYNYLTCGDKLFLYLSNEFSLIEEDNIIPIKILGYPSNNALLIYQNNETYNTIFINKEGLSKDLSNTEFSQFFKENELYITLLYNTQDYFIFRVYSDNWINLHIYSLNGEKISQGKIFAQSQLGVYNINTNYKGYYLIEENKDNYKVQIIYYD